MHCNNILLLDSVASIPLIFNKDLLDNISPLKCSKHIHSGGGHFQLIDHGGLLTVALQHLPLPKDRYFFHPDAVANILLMAKVSDHHWTTMDTDINNAIYVFNDNVTYIHFHRINQDVYEMQIGDSAKTEQCHFTTVKGIEMQYSALDWKRAVAVRSLQECLGYPSDVDLANVMN